MKLKIEFHKGGLLVHDQECYSVNAEGDVSYLDKYIDEGVEARLVPDPDMYVQEWCLIDVECAFDNLFEDEDNPPAELTLEEKRDVLLLVEDCFDAEHGTSWTEFENAVADVIDKREGNA